MPNHDHNPPKPENNPRETGQPLILAISGGLMGLGISAAIMGFVWPVAIIGIASALVFGGLKMAYDYQRKPAQKAQANLQENAQTPAPHASTTAAHQPRKMPNAREELLEGRLEKNKTENGPRIR